jgi:integrase
MHVDVSIASNARVEIGGGGSQVARRAHGDGAIYQRKDGRWEGALDLGRDGSGQRQRLSVYGRSRREVAKKLEAAKRDKHAGLDAGAGAERLSIYLARWLAQRDPRTPANGVRKLRYTTWTGYEARLRRHVVPSLGAIAISKLTPEHVRSVLGKLAASGLSSTTIACTRDTLSTALRRAVKDRLIPFNPVEAVDAVQRSQPHAYRLTAEQARTLLGVAVGDPLGALYVVALRAGLRQSELLGLRWRDVDLEAATLTVRSALVRVRHEGLRDFDPKTAASAATIPLPSAAVAALRAHRTRQIELRLRAGTRWQDTGYVFTTEVGTPISASNLLRRSFYPLCARADIPTRPGLRFHDLRHACGSLLIAEGVRPKLVQAILRHSKLATTMDLYVHSFDDDLRGAVASLDRALGS